MTNKLIKTYDQFEVVKVPFPFTDIQASKMRPAIVLSSGRSFNAKIGFSIMAMVTSFKPSRNLWPADIVIKDLQAAGLPAPSVIRFKLFTLDHRLILGHLGRLSDEDSEQLRHSLKVVLHL